MNKQKILELLDQLREVLSDDDDEPAKNDDGKKSSKAQTNPPKWLDTHDDDGTDEDRKKRDARRERMGLAPKTLPAAFKVGVGTFEFSQHNLAQARAAKGGHR